MQILGLAFFICLSVSLTVQIYDSNQGIENVYKGEGLLNQTILTLSPYNVIKNQLSAEEIFFIKQTSDSISFDLNEFVKMYYNGQVNLQKPYLAFRYYLKQQFGVAIFSQDQKQQEYKLLNEAIGFGRDAIDLQF